MLHEHEDTHTSLCGTLSLLQCHPDRPTLNTVVHVDSGYPGYQYSCSLLYTFHHDIVTELHDTITACLCIIAIRIHQFTGHRHFIVISSLHGRTDHCQDMHVLWDSTRIDHCTDYLISCLHIHATHACISYLHITITHAGISCLHIIVTHACHASLWHMLIWFLYILVIWITMPITCITVPCSRIHVIRLFPVTDMDIPDTGHAGGWYAICGLPHLLIPLYCSRYIVPDILFPIPVILFYAINRALVQLSCYPYHVQ